MSGTKVYLVEGWRRGSCVAFRRMARLSTVVRYIDHLILDQGATSVWVRRDGLVLADRNANGYWRFADADLQAAYEGDR